jgi:hypothetical protein
MMKGQMAEIETTQVKIEVNNKETEVLRDIFVSRKEMYQARTESNQEKKSKTEVNTHRENLETTIQSIRSELEDTKKHRVEDVLSCQSKDVRPPERTDRETWNIYALIDHERHPSVLLILQWSVIWWYRHNAREWSRPNWRAPLE